MSLRARILVLFFGLGVVPILLLGVIGYTRSMKAVRGLLEAQTHALASEAASEILDRYDLRLSELLLIAENAETQQLYQAHSGQQPTPSDTALQRATSFLADAWARFGASYRDIRLRDEAGRILFSLGADGGVTAWGTEVIAGSSIVSPTARFVVPVPDLNTAERIGTVEASVRLPIVLPAELLENVFGPSGYTVVMDRGRGEILHHPSRTHINQAAASLLGSSSWDVDAGTLDAPNGSFGYREGDSNRVASFVSLETPPWTVISTASLDEFVAPFRGAQRGFLLIVLVLVAVVAGAFLVSTRRATASLEALTLASERVGKGDLAPSLPPTGPDEVGRLSAAFGLMVEEVRQMLRRVEETRQMAIMGEFASSISHEIRNPLTSIKLNLQGLEEEAKAEGLSEPSIRSLGICLREVAHLEEAVRKILDMARTHPPSRVAASLHETLRESVELLETQLGSRGVKVRMNLDAQEDLVLADPEELKSVFVNLLVNAEEAMPHGGVVHVHTENPPGPESAETIRVGITDEGIGVPEEARDQIFRPFVTTKTEGTGFGLAVARLAVQDHEGRLWLKSGAEAAGRESAGATFLVELPLHRPSGIDDPQSEAAEAEERAS
ncbi:MAG: ATP-binding protein [Gemmatimonadota bacterium]|jgi:signal transduction histidine kinase